MDLSVHCWCLSVMHPAYPGRLSHHRLQGAAAEDDLEEEELEFSDDEKASKNSSVLAAKVLLCLTTTMLPWGCIMMVLSLCIDSCS